MSTTSRVERLLLWDYERGSLPYDLLCVLMALFLALASPELLADPIGTALR